MPQQVHDLMAQVANDKTMDAATKAKYMTEAAQYVQDLRAQTRDPVTGLRPGMADVFETMAKGIAEQIGKTLASDPVGITSHLGEQHDRWNDLTSAPTIMRALLDPPTDTTTRQVQTTMLARLNDLKQKDSAGDDQGAEVSTRDLGLFMGSMDNALRASTLDKQACEDFLVSMIGGTAELAGKPFGAVGEAAGQIASSVAETVGNWRKGQHEVTSDQIMGSLYAVVQASRRPGHRRSEPQPIAVQEAYRSLSMQALRDSSMLLYALAILLGCGQLRAEVMELGEGGGEPGAAFIRLMEAIRSDDGTTAKTLISAHIPELLRQLSAKELVLAELRGKQPENLRVLGGKTEGNKATLEVTAQLRMKPYYPVETRQGLMTLVLEDGQWKYFASEFVEPPPIPDSGPDAFPWLEAEAIDSLYVLAAAQTDYHENSGPPKTFAASLETLRTGQGAGEVRYIDDEFASGEKKGYRFTMQVRTDGSVQTWWAEAHPVDYQKTGIRSFYVDQTGVVRGADIGGAPGHAQMPELGL